MYRRFRERFGTAGLVVAVIALIAALAGTAIAAGGLTAVQKKQVTKIAKKYAGQDGAPGAVGPQGPKGDTGNQGPQGIQGIPGEDGTFSTEPLPESETLTGIWAAAGGTNDLGMAAVSLPIRVSPAPTAVYGPREFGGQPLGVELKNGAAVFFGPNPNPGTECVDTEEHFFECLEEDKEAYDEACPGSASEPEAEAGVLCIYVGSSSGSISDPFGQASKAEAAHESGVNVPFKFSGEAYVRGGWAVTG